MIYSSVLFTLLAAATLSDGASTSGRDLSSGIFARQQKSQGCLNTDLIQSASDKTGQEPGTDGIKPGQAKSATDPDNFINFCQGQTITNGQQITAGSCNGIPMGRIPAVSNMVSAIITNPKPGQKIKSGTTFNVSVQTSHLNAGNFVNPTTQYYTAPQDLDSNGDIIGHCHVTIQDIGSLTSNTAPDPSQFAFFKGIDDAGNGRGLLQAAVTGGLPAGVYRVCTLNAAQNHQPVNMPIAQRGAQDDCTKFEVSDDGAAAGAGNGGGAAGGAGGVGAASASASAATPSATTRAASASGTASKGFTPGGGQNQTAGRGGRRGKRKGQAGGR